MAGNPYGNKRRCKGCGSLAGLDGYCKNCRTKVGLDQSYKLVRDNYMENGYSDSPFFNSEFACVKTKYGLEEGWD